MLNKLVNKLFNSLRNLIKSVKILTVNDENDKQMVRVSFDGIEKDAYFFKPYGLFSNAPIGSRGIGFLQGANASNLVVIADSPGLRPKRDIEQGEAGVGNYLAGTYIFFHEDGDITIRTQDGAGTVNIEGDINMTGIISGDNVFNGATSNEHVHSQPNDSGGNTEYDTGVAK